MMKAIYFIAFVLILSCAAGSRLKSKKKTKLASSKPPQKAKSSVIDYSKIDRLEKSLINNGVWGVFSKGVTKIEALSKNSQDCKDLSQLVSAYLSENWVDDMSDVGFLLPFLSLFWNGSFQHVYNELLQALEALLQKPDLKLRKNLHETTLGGIYRSVELDNLVPAQLAIHFLKRLNGIESDFTGDWKSRYLEQHYIDAINESIKDPKAVEAGRWSTAVRAFHAKHKELAKLLGVDKPVVNVNSNSSGQNASTVVESEHLKRNGAYWDKLDQFGNLVRRYKLVDGELVEA